MDRLLPGDSIAPASQQKIRLAIDLMGGAKAPDVVLKAVKQIYEQDKSISFLLFGTQEVEKYLVDYQINLDCCKFVVCDNYVGDHDKPIQALRQGRRSTIRMMVDSVKSGEAQASVSSGNTGALMVIAKTVLGCIEGIKRPAIIAPFPTLKGKSVLLDLGANTECTDTMLYQFAMMGICFARIVLGLDDPKVGLLNVGVEEIKGRELEQKVYKMLLESGMNFFGYVEGHDIAAGVADVIVTDGFSGNIALKASEGAVDAVVHLLRQAVKENWISTIGGALLKKSLKKHFDIINPELNNGAMLVGLNGIVVKSHGGSDVMGVVNAIRVAKNLAANNINIAIINELNRLNQHSIARNHSISHNIVEKIKNTSAKILGMIGESE